jgi:hypothetical protein
VFEELLMRKQKEIAIQSCQEVIIYLDLIEQSGDIADLSFLHKDKEALKQILLLLQAANSKQEYVEIFREVREINHTFGGYVGDKVGYILTQRYDEMWHSILDLL